MKTTRLGSFSTEFEEALHELRAELQRIGAGFDALPEDTGCTPLGVGFREHAQELARLFGRLRSERSTVFVFGQENSGKSTLINAFARRPLLEVSPLPGYPTPVFVEHGATDEVACQRFDGTQLTGLGAVAARIELRRAQAELAPLLRNGRERSGEHARTKALRRVDVSVTNPEMKESRVRFVECPASANPLFENWADLLMGSHAGPGVAVFCVRAETLFHGGAFDGIEDLLALFERVFVVVNVDGASRDLSEHGEVVAGLAVNAPTRLVEAFEGQCSRERLLEAIEAEKVRLFPIDLLQAAGSAVRTLEDLPLEEEDDAESTEPLADPFPGPRASRPSEGTPALRELETALSRALDDSDELSTLIKSTLRRSREILGETLRLLEASEVARARAELARAVETKARTLEIRATLGRLIGRGEREWELEPCFTRLRERLQADARRAADQQQAELGQVFLSVLNDWFESEESLGELIEKRLKPRLSDARAEIHRAVALGLREGWGVELRAGSSFGEPVASELQATGVEPERFDEPVSDGLGALEDPQPLQPVDLDAIQVGAGFFDRLLLRSGARLRRKVFGPPTAPNRALSSRQKAKRFDAPAREALRANVIARIDDYLIDLCRRLAADATGLQVAAFAHALREDAHEKLEAMTAPLAELDERIVRLEEVGELVRGLTAARNEAVERIEPVAARHARADLDVLVPVRGSVGASASAREELEVREVGGE